jgi:hypothetical protein
MGLTSLWPKIRTSADFPGWNLLSSFSLVNTGKFVKRPVKRLEPPVDHILSRRGVPCIRVEWSIMLIRFTELVMH